MIGIGIDRDVTTAAIKAIRDVMDRNTCLDDYDKLIYDSPYKKLHIQLGVPLSSLSNIIEQPSGITYPIYNNSVNLEYLFHQLFPNCCHRQLLPYVHIQIGGLSVQSLGAKNTSGSLVERKVVIAHLSFVNEEQQRPSNYHSQHLPSLGALRQNQCVEEDSFAASVALSKNIAAAHMDVCSPSQKNNVSSVGTSLSGYKHGFHTSTTEKLNTGKIGLSSSASVKMSYDVRSLVQKEGPTVISTTKRNDTYSSIDVLAHVSASIIDDEKNDSDSVVGNDAMLHENTNIASNKIAKVRMNQRELPFSSKTQKNQIRHFVQHSYKDLSQEIPPVIYENRSDNVAISSSNLAFPMKLHEALSQIQGDKKGHIFGWLPHGRSFKIHCQHDFAAVVLPLYFVMTKKSSFLRQLNLYGFRRISDGSYYHERFLRGLKYLCLSMQRQKVNGNGVRAAGNPDEEPNLSNYPICPPSTSQQDRDHPTIEQRADTESTASMTEHDVCGKGIILIDESGSSRNEDRAARSDSGSNSINSSVEGDGRNIELDGSLTPISPSSQSIVDSNQVSITNSPRQDNFPVKLQRILDYFEFDGRTDIISWLPHGRAFMVHDIDRFVQEILPSQFNQTKYTSFQRQLHMYQITRIASGPDKGAYYHNQLLRGQPELSKRIRRSTTATPENGNSKK